MKLFFATEARFVKRHGLFYSLGGFSYHLWRRYLEHYDQIIVIARVTYDSTIAVNDSMLASYNNVSFIELPYYVGFSGYIKNRKHIHSIIRSNIDKNSCYICRLPGQIGGAVIDELNKEHIGYACEVVGNPWDVFSRGSIHHPLRPLIRIYSTLLLKQQVKNACACLYVTKSTLQNKYPVQDQVFSVGVSDVIIKDSDFASAPKILQKKDDYKLISVGSLAQMYKAPDVVLKAMSILKQKGISLSLTWLGDGKYKKEMIELANTLQLNVDFRGNVSPNIVSDCLGCSDIFILVSRTEGLPRAIIEAMAHGLPCIGSRVGGIPELLDESVLVKKNSPKQLANLIEKMINDLDFTNNQSINNLFKAQAYREDILSEQRNSFFINIKQQNNDVL